MLAVRLIGFSTTAFQMEVLSAECLTLRLLRSEITVHLPSGHRAEVVNTPPYTGARTQGVEGVRYGYKPALVQDGERMCSQGRKHSTAL